MKAGGTPVLDSRDASLVLRELLARRPAYVPELIPAEDQPSWALLQIFSRYMETVIDRLNQAPDKNLLAFLDMLGVSLIPARAARAPVVFLPLPTGVDGRIPAGTRVGAEVPGRNDPVMFETERSIAMAAAQLVEVVTLWPARDEYANHTAASAGGRAFTLLEPRRAVPHEIFIAHDTVLAFAGVATVEIEFELSTPGSAPLEIAWEHWDGQAWRPFKPFNVTDGSASEDGTAGLTRSGVVKLRAECGASQKTKVNGIEAHWVRGRLEQPLPPDPARVLPEVDRIRVRSAIERSSISPGIGLLPDRAFADGESIDLSTTFFPLGRTPDRESAFYFTNEEVFNKPEALVSLFLNRVKTPEEEADDRLAEYEPTVAKALEATSDIRDRLLDAAQKMVVSIQHAAKSLFEIAENDSDLSELEDSVVLLEEAADADPVQLADLIEVAGPVVTAMGEVSFKIKPVPGLGNRFVTRRSTIETTQDEVGEAAHVARESVSSAQAALQVLNSLSPVEAAAAGGEGPPELSPARLMWEYWNGHRWTRLIEPGENDPGNFSTSGRVEFRVPGDLQPSAINGVTARWLRVRLASGSYNRLRLVSWFDSQSDNVNFFPIIEPRPPALENFFLSYSYRSPWEQPAHFLSYNDFQFALHSRDARMPGRFFPPFRPVSDTTPALYLGFDRPLPNDLVSLFLDIEESGTPTPPLVWEAWDGFVWQALQAEDETASLRYPGIVSFIAPDVAPRPELTLTEASGAQLKLASALEAALFEPGDLLFIRANDGSELAAVHEARDNTLFLETPLSETYTSATVALAALPRFGHARDWVRARLKQGGAPAEIRMNGVHLNAAVAVQLQTIQNEVLGSGTGQPGQAFFLTQIPVLPGERIEVRELEGPRAEVELPILQERLPEQGLTEEDIRTVNDPRSGRIVEVWVRWNSRPHLFFSGPEDRHYVIERSRGRVIFGNGRNGRMPTIATNSIQVRRYRAGGGLPGNVPAGAITQVLEAAPFAQGVINPRAADGGAEAESPAAVKPRGPQTLRHRGRGLAARDYETLAHEASAGVAAVRVLPATAPNGRPAPGWITVIIVPKSQEPRPQPSFELRKQVHLFLAARMPATMPPERIGIIGPTYLPIGVAARITPRQTGEAGTVEQRVRTALLLFLHPLTGGPEGRGWPFGRNVYLSDVAAVVEAVDGVDYAQELNLLLNDTLCGEHVDVPLDRIVVAGVIRIEMKGNEEGGG
jgi:hypothetical protein